MQSAKLHIKMANIAGLFFETLFIALNLTFVAIFPSYG